MDEKEKGRLFLIGGYDLEMVEIVRLLERHGQRYEDKKLAWGAKLSDYAEFLDFSGTVVGIELVEDIKPPPNYVAIDHHNERAGEPASIEQLADLLGVELDRHQQLVAANDKGYKPAMREMGASEAEIDEIRRLDRQAQGVTEQDEQWAKEGIANKRRIFDVDVVQTKSGKFSPVVDRLDCHKLLVYNHNTLTYYGQKASKLAEHFGEEIKAGKAYSGGGENGFFGFAADALGQAEIENYVEEIANMVKDYHSYHIFLFPFRWEIKEKDSTPLEENSTPLFSEKTDLKTLPDKIGGFERKSYKRFSKREEYNEYTYFYPFVQEVLYDTGNGSVMRHYEYKLDKGDFDNTYTIQADRKEWDGNGKETSKTKEYTLDVDDIILNLYNTGIGMLSFHLRNHNFGLDKQDILNINQFGRRLYPPFLDAAKGLEGTQGLELAHKIELRLNGETLSDDFKKNYGSDKNGENNWEKLQPPKPIELPSFITELVPKTTQSGKCFNYKPILDDRMFVVGWYGAQFGLVSSLSEFPKDTFGRIEKFPCFAHDRVHPPPKGEYSYASKPDASDFWYKYVFVDGNGKGLSNRLMQERLLLAHTYDRWVENYTLIGCSRYSLVMLTSGLASLRDNHVDFLPVHLYTMYYKLAELCLLQRASIIKFSKEAATISTQPEGGGQLAERIRDLYRSYVQFTNKIYFREITAQEQGIEIYDMLRDKMGIERDIKSLGGEIAELHSYATLVENDRNNHLLTLLTIVGALFLIPSFIAGFYGMNVFPQEQIQFDDKNSILWLTLSFLGVSAITIGLVRYVGKGKKGVWRIFLSILLAASVVGLMLVPLLKKPSSKANELETKQNTIINTLEGMRQDMDENAKRIESLMKSQPTKTDTITTKPAENGNNGKKGK